MCDACHSRSPFCSFRRRLQFLGLIHERLQFPFNRRVPDVFILEHTIGVDGERMRKRFYGKHLGNRTGEAAIAVLQSCHFVFCDEVLPLLLIAVEADAQKHQRLSLKFLGDLFHVGQSFAARPAPARPEVEQNYFPRQIVHRAPLSIRGRDRKRRRQSCARQFGLADIAQRPMSVWITFRAKFHELFEAGLGRIVLLQLCQDQSIRA